MASAVCEMCVVVWCLVYGRSVCDVFVECVQCVICVCYVYVECTTCTVCCMWCA